ncbi:uncharacterized protein LOC141895071 [Acropora palmata]|uniref:uncharacterized protein LOC141895071 n=1 Tax=Acropora palmata TaxID=6131 RepID=UPI003D9FD09D
MIGNQANSRTQFLSCYTLSHKKGFKVPYNLTIVDTPGFGDTRGIEHDKVITEQIRTFFNTKGSAGIDYVDAICFVAQAANPRLTPKQKYVFDRILAMFGKNIKKNILVLFTFSDGQKPQALLAMLEAGILEDGNNFFKFNNSVLFAANSGEDDEGNFDRMFWRMGIKSFEKFFQGLAQMEPKSLFLTKQVLDERAQLEVRLGAFKEKIDLGEMELSRLKKLKGIKDELEAVASIRGCSAGFDHFSGGGIEAVIKQVEDEFNQTNRIVFIFVAELQRGLMKLSQIALKKDPLQQVDYLDLLIESEKSQARPGWQDRVKPLQKTRDAAVQINRLAKPGFDPWERFRENEETRQ